MNFIKDVLFPKFCVSCGYLGAYLCEKCEKLLVYVYYEACLYCGKRSLYGLTHPPCRRKYGIDGFMALFYYNDILKRVIKQIKYRQSKEILSDFLVTMRPQSLITLSVYRKFFKDLYLNPIPLHKARQRERGFNQAEIIANFLHKITQIPLSSIIIRQKFTMPQAKIQNRRKRVFNLKGAFRSENVFSAKNIILVDDVLTTGATVKEAAAALKRNGASKVFVFTLAKG